MSFLASHNLTFAAAPPGANAWCARCDRGFHDALEADQTPCVPDQTSAVPMIGRCMLGQGPSGWQAWEKEKRA